MSQWDSERNIVFWLKETNNNLTDSDNVNRLWDILFAKKREEVKNNWNISGNSTQEIAKNFKLIPKKATTD